MTDAVKEQTLYDAVEVLYHYAESLAMHTEFSQWMHTAGVFDPQELTDSHMSTMGIAAYQTWKAWYSIKHPILKPAVEAIASAALTNLGGTASQTSKDEYQIVEWMRQMLWDGLQEDLERHRKNEAAKQTCPTCCGECKTSCPECSEVPDEERCAFDDSVECVKEVCYECEHFPADPDDVKRHGMDKALRRARDRVPNWCINRELVRCFHAGHPCDECEHWKLGKELEEDLGACVDDNEEEDDES